MKMNKIVNTKFYEILNHLKLYGKCCIRKVYRELDYSFTSVYKDTKYLYDSGLVEKCSDKKDKRLVYLSLTEKGEKVLHYLEEILKE